jgi:hypothetical protein
MRIKVSVTADDIAKGVRQSPCDCPVALAVARALGIKGGYGGIDVDAEGVSLMGKRNLRKASRSLPWDARRFMADFDAGHPVELRRLRQVLLAADRPGDLHAGQRPERGVGGNLVSQV